MTLSESTPSHTPYHPAQREAADHLVAFVLGSGAQHTRRSASDRARYLLDADYVVTTGSEMQGPEDAEWDAAIYDAAAAALPEPTGFLVSEYSVTRHYGGSEEGGWYYDWSDHVRVRGSFEEEDDAFEFARTMNRRAEKAREELGRAQGRFSVLGGADTRYHVEQVAGEDTTTERPFYC